ncbi:hypothetical protein ASG39_20815 [Rhizobium sp. Leaf371]|uniref:hypothetical protein n=1 Tax=Rhizobium sp. Leaf371 TaxID=1736355 RepID=UPI0007140AB6|nr:hypothetical protein [Rhizobium sp. Leaf371]KQS71700.1 hypothetical protein ASG39_20815 [Rhizobium sp. Leaf371]
MNFPIVATVISMVLGLSVTRLLTGLVTVFRIRRSSQLDWVPLAWSGILFLTQLQYWWAINQLSALRPTFQFGEFLFLVLMTLMLFLTAALLLPSRGEDEARGLRVYFEEDGRFALLSLTAFFLFGLVVNVFGFQSPIESAWAVTDIPMIVLPVLAFLSRKRNYYAAITALYLPLCALDVWISLAP